jgi:hypothetical protein
MRTSILILFAIVLCSCGRDETSDDIVYDLMDFVIKDQQLDKTFGIKELPEEQCTTDKTDEEFLISLIMEDKESDLSDSIKLDPIDLMFEVGQLSKCLMSDDVAVMLAQKERNVNFRWDNSRLGFSNANKSHWYVFSVPLISEDKTKAVLMIRELCTGLCGRGWTLLVRKENGNWTSDVGKTWRH